MEISEIDRLLNADEANVQIMRRLFAEASKELPEVLDETAVLYQTCCRAFGQSLTESVHTVAISEEAIEEGMTNFIRGLLLAQIGVLYGRAVADLLRMQVTAPLTYVRLQCESLALMKLMKQDPVVAQEWRAIQTDEQGKKFFSKYHKRSLAILNSYNLGSAYNRTSGIALHSRFVGLARGTRINQRIAGYRQLQEYTIVAQEFDKEHSHRFFAEVVFTLRVQGNIFANIHDAAPEIRDPLFLETRLPRFMEKLIRLDAELTSRFSKMLGQNS